MKDYAKNLKRQERKQAILICIVVLLALLGPACGEAFLQFCGL